VPEADTRSMEVRGALRPNPDICAVVKNTWFQLI